MKPHILVSTQNAPNHPYTWLTLHPDGSVQFGRQKPTQNPALVYQNFKPESLPKPERGFTLTSHLTGDEERFEFDATTSSWTRHVTLLPLKHSRSNENGCQLHSNGNVEIGGVTHTQHDVIDSRNDVLGITYTKDVGSESALLLEHDNHNSSSMYCFNDGDWFLVLPKKPNLPAFTCPDVAQNGATTEILAATQLVVPNSGTLGEGPLTLHDTGHVEFANVLYKPRQEIPTTNYQGFIVSRAPGRRRFLRLAIDSRALPVSEPPKLLRYEGRRWFRYVPTQPTSINRYIHQVREALQPTFRLGDIAWAIVISLATAVELIFGVTIMVLLGCLLATISPLLLPSYLSRLYNEYNEPS